MGACVRVCVCACVREEIGVRFIYNSVFNVKSQLRWACVWAFKEEKLICHGTVARLKLLRVMQKYVRDFEK